MPPLGLPQLSSDPVLFLAPFLGGFRDYSGNGNHAANIGGYWQSVGGVDGFNPSDNPSSMVVPYNIAIRPPQWTWFLWGDFAKQNTEARFISTRSAGAGTWYQIYTAAANVTLRTETSLRTRVVDTTETKSLAVSLQSGATGLLYLDGVLDGAFSGPSTLVRYASNIHIGGYHAAGGASLAWRQPISGAIKYPAVLPPSEIAQLHAYSQSLITPRRQWPGSGLRYPGRGDPYTPITGDPMFLDNIQSARVSVANETSGQLSNTGMDIVTGTWRVSEDATGRYFDCVGAGQITRRLIGADGMTTRLFTGTVGASLTKTTTEIQINASGTDKIRAVQLEAA